MARPTKYSEPVGLKIVEEIRRGRPKWVAAQLFGISRDTLDEWLKRGDADDPPDEDTPFVLFAELYRQAEAEYVAQELDAIDREAGPKRGDWKRRAWKLQQRFPRQFAERKAIELTGADGETLNLGGPAAVVVLPALDDSPRAQGAVDPEPGPADALPRE